MLQYITNTDCGKPVIDQVKAVLEGGCRWIQLRMKNAPKEEVTEMAKQVKELCDPLGAYLIINDYVDICRDVNASGVHLGKMDMLPSKARIELGPLAIIGVTANTYEDVTAVRSLDIDYIGIGPFRETTTKKNLAPVLGIKGETEIVRAMEDAGIEIPRVAVGGIKLDDVLILLESGLNGIAVSGAIANSDDMVQATREFIKVLPTGV